MIDCNFFEIVGETDEATVAAGDGRRSRSRRRVEEGGGGGESHGKNQRRQVTLCVSVFFLFSM